MTSLISAYRSRGLALIVLSVVLLTGCQAAVGGAGKARSAQPTPTSRLSFKYDRLGGSGFIDQALNIHNASDVPVLLDANIRALDASGSVLPDVKVAGVYGTERRGQVLVPGDNLDFLVFTGPGSSNARDVEVVDVRVRNADFPEVTEPVEAVPLDASDNELDYPAGVAKVTVRNPNPAAVTVRVVGIIWNQPAEGRSQQALKVIPLSDLTTVPASGETTVEVDRAHRLAISEHALSNALSLKAYLSL